MGNQHRETPASLTPGWPEASSPDSAAETARVFANSLRDAIGNRSVRSVASSAGLDEATVRRVLTGDAWPDLRTVARLEDALLRPLYPRWGDA